MTTPPSKRLRVDPIEPTEKVVNVIDEEMELQRLELRIQCTGPGHERVRLIQSFQAMALPPYIHRILQHRGVFRPTPIQMQSIPVACDGRDVVAQAETGSGKTLAYLLPVVTRLWRHKQSQVVEQTRDPSTLIVLPTRELVEQVFHSLRDFAFEHIDDATDEVDRMTLYTHGDVLRIIGVCGGLSLTHQMQRLAQGVDVVVATPGRLIDLFHKGAVRLGCIQCLIVDEVDKMLNDLDMEQQLRTLLVACNRKDRQTLLWSATLPQRIEPLVLAVTNAAIHIRIGKDSDIANGLSRGVIQDVQFAHTREKKARLLEALRSTERPPVLVIFAIHMT